MNDALELDDEKKTAEARRKRLVERKRSDALKVMSMPEGRRFVRGLLSASGRIDGPQVPVSGEVEMTYFRFGRWQMGEALILLLQTECPDLWMLMEREHKSDQLQAETEKKTQEESNG